MPSVYDTQAPKKAVKVSPKQMEVATQLFGLYCQPEFMTHTQEGETTSGKTAKQVILDAIKSQFYNVCSNTTNFHRSIMARGKGG
jgi:hypothetical protein